MISAVETVFGIPELLDQILKDVYPSDIFVLQRTNKIFRQTILRTSHVRPRRLARICDPEAAQDAAGEIKVDFSLLFASRFFLSFLFLDPFTLANCSALIIPGHRPILHLQYLYIPTGSTTARRLWLADTAYSHTKNIAMRKGDQLYNISPSWAYVWLPDAAIRISLKVYRHKRKHAYTETMQLEPDKAEMRSVAMALGILATRSESRWSSGQVVGEETILKRRI
ncbi:hypothetical protein Q7P35_006446 [Cladosporium inversicolor]